MYLNKIFNTLKEQGIDEATARIVLEAFFEGHEKDIFWNYFLIGLSILFSTIAVIKVFFY